MPAGSVILLLTSQNRHLVNTLAPFTRNFELSAIPRVYICRNYSCRSPVPEPQEIIDILGKPHSANCDCIYPSRQTRTPYRVRPCRSWGSPTPPTLIGYPLFVRCVPFTE